MELGMLGLGRMGMSMATRLVRGGHRVVGYARSKPTVAEAEKRGVVGAESLADVVSKLSPPRVVWMMIPAGAAVDETLEGMKGLLSPDDLIVDGGNSYYRDTVRRASVLTAGRLRFVDVGTSGGIWGLTEGYSMMVGGEAADVERLRPALETLAPAPNQGWGHVGPVGAGHFVKMVHNGIEYGLMQAYAEGFAILQAKAELHLDLRQVSEIWRSGSVVRSWLLDLIAQALAENPALSGIQPFVADSGEGRWTVVEAIDLDVSAPVITLSLEQRLRSRDRDPFADRLLAVMRRKFGGHAVQTEK
jgi:6-phosphogluconate dehydrogenase